MLTNECETRLVKFLSRKRKPDGSAYGPNYVKDKVARLRKLEQIFESYELENITDSNYFHFADLIMDAFKQPIGNKNTHYKYADYLVVLRFLYEMNNKGKKAPRYAYYGGVKVV